MCILSISFKVHKAFAELGEINRSIRFCIEIVIFQEKIGQVDKKSAGTPVANMTQLTFVGHLPSRGDTFFYKYMLMKCLTTKLFFSKLKIIKLYRLCSWIPVKLIEKCHRKTQPCSRLLPSASPVPSSPRLSPANAGVPCPRGSSTRHS